VVPPPATRVSDSPACAALTSSVCCSVPFEMSFGLSLAMLAASWRPNHGGQGHC
jgi:hypothetical protein